MAPNSEMEDNLEYIKKSDDRYVVKYRKNYYDITEFVIKHPGGVNTLQGLNKSDMTARFMRAPPHSDAAMYLMNEYLIEEFPITQQKPQDNNSDCVENVDGGVCQLRNHLTENNNNNNNNNNNEITDESMEHLVDWSQAMLPQISKISEYYNDWVHKPVDRPLKLFNAWYLEICTKTVWWLIPIFWLPIVSKIIYNEFTPYILTGNKFQLIISVGYFLAGIVFWTFLEYVLHRYVFHMPLNQTNHPWLCTVHFLIHGLHHKVPFDSKRLVFPPIPGVILTVTIYAPLSVIFPQPRILLAGSLFGYVCYDMIHYYLHYGNPVTAHLYQMKRYHYQHHFAHQDMGYGISTPLWDFIFKTHIQLRKLKYHLRWK